MSFRRSSRKRGRKYADLVWDLVCQRGLRDLIAHTFGHELTIQRLLGVLAAPFAFLIGVPWSEAGTAGALIGLKVVLNELLAYLELVKLPAAALSDKSRTIMTYALRFQELGQPRYTGWRLVGHGARAAHRDCRAWSTFRARGPDGDPSDRRRRRHRAWLAHLIARRAERTENSPRRLPASAEQVHTVGPRLRSHVILDVMRAIAAGSQRMRLRLRQQERGPGPCSAANNAASGGALPRQDGQWYQLGTP
jgi:hypothetical protein